MGNPDETRIFYEQLSVLINSIKQRDVLINGENFHAKTKLLVSEMEYQLAVGKYLGYSHKEIKIRDPKILHLSLIQKDINIKLNSVKDKQKEKVLKKEKK